MDDKKRCSWAEKDPEYIRYHDEEWGVPLREDRRHFEKLVLEAFQAGLSWITILKKRDNFREAFDNFDFEKVAKYDEEKIQSLMKDAGIVRNERKIRAAVENAKAFQRVREEFGTFDNYIWSFVKGKPKDGKRRSMRDVPVFTPLSDRISKDLKKRGFKFVGKTMMYSYMQSTGMINDHVLGCFRHDEVNELGKFNKE